LDHASFKFERGQAYAIVGKSGCGKTSLLKAILGLTPLKNGTIKYDAIPIQQLDEISPIPKFGYLPQEIELFETTIAKNIARLQIIDPEKVVQAAKIVQLHEFILKLPEGYQSVLGVDGIILSGGQRQRIALARAIYDSPDIVVLDEPNSYLDQYGDRALIAALEFLRDNKATVFVATHREELLSTVDHILTIDNGLIQKLN